VSIGACDAVCPTGQHKCWDICNQTCSQPYYIDLIQLMAFDNPQDFDYYLFKADGMLNTNDVRAIVSLEKTGSYPNMTVFMRSAYSNDTNEVGPEPHWPSPWDPLFFVSSIMYGTFSGVTAVYDNDPSMAVYLIFRHPVQTPVNYQGSELEAWGLGEASGLQYMQENYCVAYAVPWYWDPTDLDPNSGLANLTYIQAYRLNATGNWTGPLPPTPPLRWQCQLNNTNAWPRTIPDVPFYNDTRPSADKWLGIRIGGDTSNTIMAMVLTLNLPPPQPPVTPPLTVPPPNPIAIDVVLAVAALLLAILIVVVVIKSLNQRN